MSSVVPTIYFVDDDASFLRAMARLLRVSGHAVQTYSSAEAFLTQHGAEARGCVLVDLRMTGPSGLELQASLATCENPLPVVFLTGHGDIPTSVRAMKQGAEDFLTKPVQKTALLEAVDRALRRDGEAHAQRERLCALRGRYEALTPREREVMAAMVQGGLNKEIAGDLGATERTIKAHRAKVMEKMQARSPAELGAMAQAMGLS